MWRLWPCLVLAACSSDGSVEIVVNAPADLGVVEVELYVGIYHTHEDPEIRPPKGLAGPNVWWKRDPNHDLDVQAMTPDGVKFQLLAGDESDEDTIAAVVAVGFGGDPANPTPVGVATRLVWTEIPDGEVHRYLLELGPFEPLPRYAPSDLPGLFVWGPWGGNRRECVQVDNVPELAEFDEASTGLVVTIGDIDCDGAPDGTPLECVENEFMSQLPMVRNAIDCAIATPQYVSGQEIASCVAGGVTCVDGLGIDLNHCAPTSYCLPTGRCSDPLCSDSRTCNPYVGGQNSQEITCTAYANDVRALCGSAWSAQFDVAQLFNIGVVCDHDKPALIRSGRAGTFSNTADIVGTGGGVITVEIKPVSGCVYELVPTGTIPNNAAGDLLREFVVTLTVPLDAPQAGRGLMLPVHFTLETNNVCSSTPSAPSPCFLNPQAPDPGLVACLRTPPAAGTITFD